MLTVPPVQALAQDAASSEDPQVRAIGAIAGALLLLYMQRSLENFGS